MVFSGKGQRVPKMSLALGQPQGCTGASLACSRARDMSGTLRPSSEKTTRSFPYRSSGKSRNSGLVWGARLRGRTATQRSKKGSEKVLERVLGEGSHKGSEKGACCGFYSKQGF